MSALTVMREFNALLQAPLEDGGPQKHFDQEILTLFRADRAGYDERAQQTTLDYVRTLGDADGSKEVAPQPSETKKPAAKRTKRA